MFEIFYMDVLGSRICDGLGLNRSLFDYQAQFDYQTQVDRQHLEGIYKATWKRELKLSYREAGPPNHLDDGVDSDQ